MRRRSALLVAACLSWALVAGALTARVEAAIEPSIFHIGEFGAGAGQLEFAGGGIAADPMSGHLFVSEPVNNRISEYTAWGEFVKAWGWGVKDGGGALQTCGPPQPQLSPQASLCRAGTGGAGAGQLRRPDGIALGPNRKLYVFERENRRVQVFDEAGAFVLMFGGGVDHTTGADICTAADLGSGDECGQGTEGAGPSEFSVGPFGTSNDYIDVAADGTVYVGDQNRVQEFEPDGSFKGQLSFAALHAADPDFPGTGNPGALAVDPPSGDVYFGFALGLAEVSAPAFRLDPATGSVVHQLPTTAPEGIAAGPTGNVYVADDPEPERNTQPEFNPHLLEIDPLGNLIDECCSSTSRSGESVSLPALTTDVVTAAGEVDLYVAHSSFAIGEEVAFIDARGPAPERFLPPPSVPPTIEAQQARSVGEHEASLGATINPNFWDDTHYRLEYGTAPCSVGGCESTAERELGAGIVRQPVPTEAIELSGLDPGTTYHYRFVAESGGGGPVFGGDRTFTTFAPEPARQSCPNDAFRLGAGAGLPDCRAYELVSPVDKSGGDILVQGNINSTPARLDQAAPSGEAVTYSSYRSFGDAESAPYQSQYVASRGAGGWSTHGISPPQQNGVVNGSKLDSNYKGFTEDLSGSWLVQDAEPPLAPGAVPGYANLYRRDNGSGAYEALSTAMPEAGPSDYGIELQGASADGKRTIFRANGKLTMNAAPGAIRQLYESFNGKLRLVSVKPAGTASTTDSSAGSVASANPNGREANAGTAVSEDGTKIYWSEVGGRVFVRVNTTKTVAVSPGAATFWAAKPDGSAALYTEGEALKLFTLASESSATLVGEGVQGVMGASKDLSRIYFVSSAALAGTAKAGAPNVYLYEAGQPLAFIATLGSTELNPTLPSPVALSPRLRFASVNSDGGVAVFASRAALTGADNADQVSGEADAEVFRYEAASHRLRCISCSPTGQAPRGRALVVDGQERGYWYASRFPGWEFELHAPRVIAAGGNRVFFDSLNRLVPADTNDAEDVYQWEAPGTGACTEGSTGFEAATGGCVSLISSGTDERDSEFVDASADGRDAFFLTGQSLVSWDPGQVDLYDAREGGGFPAPPPVRSAECEGEGCQVQGAQPPPAGNASQGFVGPGNPPARPGCRKGFVRRHGKCEKKHRQKKSSKHRRHAKQHSARGGR